MQSRPENDAASQLRARECAARLGQIERMIGELRAMAERLEAQIAREEEKSGISDPEHVAYSTFASSMRRRRDNLRSSAQALAAFRGEASEELDQARSALKRSDPVAARSLSPSPAA